MTYQMTDIKLGAAILCEVPGTYFMGVDMDRIVNSKRVIEISCPDQYGGELKKVINDYTRKVQCVNVYKYNRALCLIRDALRGNIENGHRLQGRETEHGAYRETT